MSRAFEIRVVRDVMIPTRDGTRLAANLYLPEGAGAAPAIVQYAPYLKDGMGGRGSIEIGQRHFAHHGYTAVSIDLRGYGMSEGLPPPPFAAQEKDDGHDALGWIATQPWCDGRTGMWGISYGGNTALSVASTRPASLRAIVAIHAIDDEFTGSAYPHGCRGALVGEIDWGFRVAAIQLLPPLRVTTEPWLERWRARLEGIDAPFPFYWHTIPPSTWAGWRAEIESVEAPTYAVSAFHDSYPGETAAYYRRLRTAKRLLLGPWKHELPDLAVHHPIGFFDEMVGWFDRWIKGDANGDPGTPPVVWFAQPTDSWRGGTAWPPESSRLDDYFAGPDGSLGTAPAPCAGFDEYAVDPTVGLAALPWDWTTPTPPTPSDISPDDHRALSYTTAPLEQPLLIAGDPDLIVHLEADQPDFPLRAWLSDVRPSGFSTLICQGWVRPMHELGERLRAGQVYTVRVPLFPTAYRVPAGNRLRLCIAGAHFPALVSAPVSPRLVVHRSIERSTTLRLPIAEERHPEAGHVPSFRPPLGDRPEAQLTQEGSHRVSRDLYGGRAAYVEHKRSVFRLEDGAILSWDLQATVAVEPADPRSLEMTGEQVWRLERSNAPIVLRLEARETFDDYRIGAQITLDGRPFFERSWQLDLRTAPWRVQT